MPVDKCLPSFYYQRNFKLFLQGWPTEYIPSPCDIQCFMDGSRLNGFSGAGVLILFPNSHFINITIPLGKFPTVFQAEIIAITNAIYYLKSINTINIIIHIITDSQAAMLAIKNPKSVSKTINVCKQALCSISCVNQVAIHWIKGHSGHPGNEAADWLAKKASMQVLTGPEPTIPIPYCILKEELKLYIKNKILVEWTNHITS